MIQEQGDDSRWSSIGSAMVLLLAAEFAVTIAVASGALPLVLNGRNMFPLAAACAIGSMLVALRCRMPRWAKAGGSIVIAAGLLTVAATQDLFGIRTLNARVSGALRGQGEAPEPVAETAIGHPGDRVSVAIHPAQARDDNGFAEALSEDVVGQEGRSPAPIIVISGATDYTASPAGDIYGLNWSIRRGPEARWCGRTSIMTVEREVAINAARDTIARAIAASAGDKARCEKHPESSG